MNSLSSPSLTSVPSKIIVRGLLLAVEGTELDMVVDGFEPVAAHPETRAPIATMIISFSGMGAFPYLLFVTNTLAYDFMRYRIRFRRQQEA